MISLNAGLRSLGYIIKSFLYLDRKLAHTNYKNFSHRVMQDLQFSCTFDPPLDKITINVIVEGTYWNPARPLTGIPLLSIFFNHFWGHLYNSPDLRECYGTINLKPPPITIEVSVRMYRSMWQCFSLPKLRVGNIQQCLDHRIIWSAAYRHRYCILPQVWI